MPIPALIKHSGFLIAKATVPASSDAEGPISTDFCAIYAANKRAQEDIAGATMLAPVVLPLENVVKVRVGVFFATGGSCVLLLTSAAGTDQAVPLGDAGLYLFHNPHAGDEITAIKLVGTGTVSYFIAGDAS
jgi:hypothetical protein